MIMHRRWFVTKYKPGTKLKIRSNRASVAEREGWFLIGLIPLYIRTVQVTVFS